MQSLKELKPERKKILVRLDLDVAVKNGKIEDSFRIDAALPTLRYLRKGKKIYLIGHCGRPEGKIVESLRLRPQAKYLAEKLGLKFNERKCRIFEHRYLLGEKIEMLENLRFFKGEEENSKLFAKKYASLAEVFVFESFAVSHRKHASVFWLSRLLPTFLGFRAEKEIGILEKIKKEAKNTIVLVGGAKAEDKADLIFKFNALILAGGKTANELFSKRQELIGKNIILPKDGVLENGVVKNYGEMSSSDLEKVRDIGPETLKFYKAILEGGPKNVILAGPMGQFEKKNFGKGTKELLKEALKLNKKIIILGGDSAFAVKKFGFENKVFYISVGGGASLNYLVNKEFFVKV